MSESQRNSRSPCGERYLAERRRVLAGAVAFGMGGPLIVARARANEDPRTARPTPGDLLVFHKGARKGEVIAPPDLKIGGPQTLAYPMEPATKTVRDGSKLNQVALVRFDPSALSDETRPNAAEGIVGYSAICPHQGCPVSMWNKRAGALFCSCHGSQFDPKDGARRIKGPAPHPLAALPLKIEDGKLVVASEFKGPVGAKRKS